MDVRCAGGAGGILGLLKLIEEHRDAFEYDWRTRFGLPLKAIFSGEMSWREAAAMTRVLAADSSSRVFAAVHGWDYPMSQEALILADQFDAFTRANFKKPKPYPRPVNKDRTRSKKPLVSQSAIRAALAARGHGRRRIAGELPPGKANGTGV